MISKLKKLKGRSFAELADRGRQKVGALAERTGLQGSGALSDEQFLGSLNCEASDACQLLEYFRHREKKHFYPSFDDRERTTEVLRRQFPQEQERLVLQAEKILNGRFDLLGFSDLDFGGPMPDWHLEPLSRKRSPLAHRSEIAEIDSADSGDKKIVWELNRHQYFMALGSAYWLTGDEKYANGALKHIEDWIAKNPLKLGVNWISSLEVAYRSISWIWALNFFLHSSAMKPEMLVQMLKILAINGRHIENNLSTYSSPNTHLTGEALALFTLGTFLPEIFDADRWRSKGRGILENELDKQFRDDGGYVEQSTHYHRYTADIYLGFYILLRSQGESVAFPPKFTQSLEFLSHMAQPNGRTPLIGDDDGGRLHFLDSRPIDDFRATLAVGAALLKDSNLKFVAGEASPELLWLFGPQGIDDFDSIQAVRPAETSRPFAESGFYSIKSGWENDATFLLIDCGPHGFLNGGHAHADALGFVLSVSGIPVFVDSGTHNYTADLGSRNYFRSTSAHNCLTVDGESSSLAGGPFAWESMANCELLEWKVDRSGTVFFRGKHDGFARLGVGYEREVRFVTGGEIRIVDKITTRAPHSFAVNFILSPDIDIVSCDAKSVLLRTKDGNQDLLRIDTKLADDCVSDGWKTRAAEISPRYGSLIETSKLVLEVEAGSDFEIVNRLIPLKG